MCVTGSGYEHSLEPHCLGSNPSSDMYLLCDSGEVT